MSGDGFNQDDLSSTFARFSQKRHNIICDEAKLKHKSPEPVTLSSATHVCGTSILKGVASFIQTTNTRDRNAGNDEPTCSEGWMNGAQGYGYYRNGIKD